MSPDEIILERVLREIKRVGLEAILVGNVAAVLQGVPVMTQDIDFFVRDTKLNREKIIKFAKNLGLTLYKRDNAISDVISAESKDFVIDFVFGLAPDQKFESVRSRAKRIKIGNHFCYIADLNDILRSKKYANRPKDRAVIGLIEDTIKIKREI